MDKALGMQNPMVDNVVLLASRLLLAWIFVHEGVFLATNFAAASAGMAKAGVPALALVATIGLQLVAGIAIAVGWHARLGAAALGLFCLATAILFHTNFANRNELLHFEKDLAIAGGMFILMLRGAGGYSVQAFARQRDELLTMVGNGFPGFLNWGRISVTTRSFRKRLTDRQFRYNQVHAAPRQRKTGLQADRYPSDRFGRSEEATMTLSTSDDNSVLLVHAYLDGELDPANALEIAAADEHRSSARRRGRACQGFAATYS